MNEVRYVTLQLPLTHSLLPILTLPEALDRSQCGHPEESSVLNIV